MVDNPRRQNWYTKFTKWFGPGLYLETGNPKMGDGGAQAFTMFSSTKKGQKFSLGMKETGLVSLNADVNLEIIAGEENDPGGQDILIHSRNGDIDIKVQKNGDVSIKGGNVRLTADDTIFLNGKVIRLDATDEISLQAPYIWSRGKRGNLVPKSFSKMITFGSFIGGGVLGSLAEKGLNIASGLAPLASGLNTLPIGALSGNLTNAISAGGLGGLPSLSNLSGAVSGNLSNAFNASGGLSKLTGGLTGNFSNSLTGGLSNALKTGVPGLQNAISSGVPGLENVVGKVSNLSNLDISGGVNVFNKGLQGFSDAIPGMQDQLFDASKVITPQLQNFAEGPGAAFGEQLKSSGVFANLTGQLNEIKIPKGLQ